MPNANVGNSLAVYPTNLGKDPEMRYTPSGKPVTNFSVAVNRRWKDSEGELHEVVKWFEVAAWNGLAEVCNQYLAKGRQVLVTGTIDAEAWVDNAGETRTTLKLNAAEVKFLGSNSESPGE